MGHTGSNRTLLAWVFLFLYPFNAFAGGPTVQIKSTVDQVIQTLTNPQLQGEGKRQERRKKLREVIFVRFDFQEMAQRSLGAQWQRRTPEEQTGFVRISSDLLEKTYVDKIESYNNEKFIYTNEKMDGRHAEVCSKMRSSSDPRDRRICSRHLEGEIMPCPVEEWSVVEEKIGKG
jgi:phospholipid transport system substrate-binding protein